MSNELTIFPYHCSQVKADLLTMEGKFIATKTGLRGSRVEAKYNI